MIIVPTVELTLLGFPIAMIHDTVACPNDPLRTTCSGTAYTPAAGTWPQATREPAAKLMAPEEAATPTGTTCKDCTPMRGELVGVMRGEAVEGSGGWRVVEGGRGGVSGKGQLAQMPLHILTSSNQ